MIKVPLAKLLYITSLKIRELAINLTKGLTNNTIASTQKDLILQKKKIAERTSNVQVVRMIYPSNIVHEMKTHS